MRRMRIKTMFSLIFALMVALTVLMVSIFSGIFINRQFEEYVKETQQKEASELAKSIEGNYDVEFGGFNIDYVHGMGMYALNEGFIIRLYDKDMNLLWDAENHDMKMCHEVMDGIMLRMKDKKPELEGEFVTYSYDLKSGEELNGVLEISYYTPFYMNENEFRFIQALNLILAIVGTVSTVLAIFFGILIAKRISSPISGVITATGKISEGDYDVRVDADPKLQEIYELSDAVNTMAGTLKEQEYLRKQMTADIAHELRTPVSNISSNMEMMIEDVIEPTRDRLQNCYDELMRLSGLINDLERLETVESKEIVLEKEDINLYALSDTILQSFKSRLDDKKITSKLEGEELHIFADKGRIGQVISNLLSNAVKYTDENGSIRILVKKDMDKALLVVEDSGIGIPKEDQERVFERFYRTDKSRTRKTGGTGIGLTITKAIVQAHGGTIHCESEPGEGSRFIVTLPL